MLLYVFFYPSLSQRSMTYPKGTRVLVTSHDTYQGKKATVVGHQPPWIHVTLDDLDSLPLTIHPSCVHVITPKNNPQQ